MPPIAVTDAAKLQLQFPVFLFAAALHHHVGLQMLLALLCQEVVQPLQADPQRNVVRVGCLALAAPEPSTYTT